MMRVCSWCGMEFSSLEGGGERRKRRRFEMCLKGGDT